MGLKVNTHLQQFLKSLFKNPQGTIEFIGYCTFSFQYNVGQTGVVELGHACQLKSFSCTPQNA